MADGHLRKRGPGVWQLSIYVGRRNGQSRYAYRTIHATSKRDADSQKREILRTWEAPKSEPVADDLEKRLNEWLDGKYNLKPTSVESYRKAIAAILKHLPHNPDEIPAAVEQLRSTYSSATLGQWAAVLQQALGIKVKRKVQRRTVLVVPLPEEIQELLERLPPGLKVFAGLCYYAGLRKGEALGLKWRSIQDRKLRVEEQAVRLKGRGRVETDPKSNRVRTVVIPEALEAILEAEKTRQATDKKFWGSEWGPGEHVCQYAAGRPWEPDTLTHTWRREVGKPNPHLLRHAFAAHLLDAGVDPKTIQEMLGHHSVVITLGLYGGRSTEAQHQRAADLLDTLATRNRGKSGRGEWQSGVRRVK